MKRSYSRLKIKTRYDKELIKPENRILNAQREVPQKFWALMGIGEFSMFFFFVQVCELCCDSSNSSVAPK